jgi:hypothetical protein
VRPCGLPYGQSRSDRQMQQVHCGGSSADCTVRLSCKVNSSWDVSTRQTVRLGTDLRYQSTCCLNSPASSLAVTCFSPSGRLGWCFQFKPGKLNKPWSRFRGTELTPFMRSEGLYLEAIIASLLATGAVKSCGDSSLLCDRS